MKNFLVFTLLAVAFTLQAQVPKFITNQTWLNGDWVNQTRTNYTTDKNGFVLENIQEVWTPTATTWRATGRTTCTNNTSGLEVQSFIQYWDMSKNNWMTTYTVQNTYNASNKVSMNSKLGSNSGSSPSYEVTNYYYDTKGFLTSCETKRLDNNGVLTIASKITYTNNSSGFPEKKHFTNFQGGVAVNEVFTTYSYFSGGKVSEMVVQAKTGTGAWMNDYKTTSEYDVFGFLVSTEDFDWNGSNWAPSTRIIVTNFPDGKIDFWVHEMYAGNGTWQKWQKTTYDWLGTGTTGISEFENDRAQPVIYFDLNGRQVEKQKNVLLIEQLGNERRKIIIQE